MLSPVRDDAVPAAPFALRPFPSDSGDFSSDSGDFLSDSRGARWILEAVEAKARQAPDTPAVLDASGVLGHAGPVDRACALSGPIDAVAQEFPAGTGHLANEERSPVGGGGAAPAHPALTPC